MHTNRDRQIVGWIGALGAAGATHVQRRFGMGRSQTYQRLHELVAGGLLSEHRLLYGRPALYAATAEGLRWAGLRHLGLYRVGPGSFEHTAEVAAVAAELHQQLAGWEVVSERTIRALESETDGLIGSVKVGELPGGRAALHRPDLLIESETATVAVEVELSVKAPRRLEAICRGYARARHLDHTYYLATPPAARAVERATQRVRAADRITVLPLDRIDRLAAELSSRRV
jgi:hypothetical protein